MAATPPWTLLLASLGSPGHPLTPGPSSPITKAPKAWAAVSAELGSDALTVFVGATLSPVLQRVAVKLVSALIEAAKVIEPLLPSLGSSETAAHVQWRADLASVNELVADIDGGASTGATARELNDRIQEVRRDPSRFSSAKIALLSAIAVPPETGVDVSFTGALGAVKFFFL